MPGNRQPLTSDLQRRLADHNNLPVFIDDQPWMIDALCAQTDPDAFFPDKGGSTKDAKATCRRCLVAELCLTYALKTEQRFGIWGGYSERERRNIIAEHGPRVCRLDDCDAPVPPHAHRAARYCGTAHQLLAQQLRRAETRKATA